MAELVPVAQKFATIRDVLEKRKADIAKAIPRGIDAQRFVRVALSQFQIKPDLLECTPASVFTAIMQAAGWGLELDAMLGQAYLVPYKDRKAGVTVCQLQLGYRGMLALARRSGEIANFLPGIVHERDEFTYQRAGRRPDGSLGTILEHVEYDGPDDPGPVTATYIAMITKDGHEQIDVMYRRDIDKSRSRSRAKDSGPWTTDFEPMALKSVVRRASKFWPLETSVAAAINQDELVDLGIETPIMPALTEGTEPAALPTDKPPAKTLETLIAAGASPGAAAAVMNAEPAAVDEAKTQANLHQVVPAQVEAKPEPEAPVPMVRPSQTPLGVMTEEEYNRRVAYLHEQMALIIAHDAKPPEVTKTEPTDAELDAEIARKEAELEAERAKHVAVPTGQNPLTAEEQARERSRREQAERHEPPRAHRPGKPAPAAQPPLVEREPGQEG